MPTEDQDIGFDKDFRQEIFAKVTNARLEKKYSKQLMKTINNDDITLFFSSLIKIDSLFWFLKIIHHVYRELFLLYNNTKYLVFNDNLLGTLKTSWQWINRECEIIHKEHELIIKLKVNEFFSLRGENKMNEYQKEQIMEDSRQLWKSYKKIITKNIRFKKEKNRKI